MIKKQPTDKQLQQFTLNQLYVISRGFIQWDIYTEKHFHNLSAECLRLRKFVEAVENTVEVCNDNLYPSGKPCGKCGWCDIDKALADLRKDG